MATLSELAESHTNLSPEAIAHLQRLMPIWGVLADLCFSDLLLFAKCRPPQNLYAILGQVRPNTEQTLHLEDLMGKVVDSIERPLVFEAAASGTLVEGEYESASFGQARSLCIPVRFKNQVIAVVARESALLGVRRPGRLERTYLHVFQNLATMMTRGEFPYEVDEERTGLVPRVGDGAVVLDATGRVDYASPNAVSALHRLSVNSTIEGATFFELGLDPSVVDLPFETKLPKSQEYLGQGNISVVIRCLPLIKGNQVDGALLLVRDISELRERDRLLLSKDTAIKEVHHRVKNNLQTISSLLRLQARRAPEGEARLAIQDAEMRVRSIALVHEILSQDTSDKVDFGEILNSLVQMTADLPHGGRPVDFEIKGAAGILPGEVATPLAVVVTELLQNSTEHGWSDPSAQGTNDPQVTIGMERSPSALTVKVSDNGQGFPPSFSIDSAESLGLSIVRNLVETQLNGKIFLYNEKGATVEVSIPLEEEVSD